MLSYILRWQVIISKKSLKIDFVLANSTEPDEMPPNAALQLDLDSFAKSAH